MKLIDVEDNKNNQIVKANKLIECKGSLSQNAQKLLAMLISMIRTDDTELQAYAMNIKDFLNHINSNSNNTEAIKECAEELMRNPFWIDGKLFNWCSYVDIKKMDGYIIMEVHRYLRPYLLQLKGNFTQYHIINILSLKGDYSPRLYEYLLMQFNEYKSSYKKQHKKIPKSYTLEMEIDWLREYLQIPNTYRYNNIKVQIIEVAKKQFKAKTDIKFNYEEQKLGRKVVRLILKLENNNQGSNNILLSIHSFIKHIRYICKPDVSNEIYPTIISTPEGNLKLDSNGKLYLIKKDNKIKNYEAKKSQELWNWLYELAKNDKLELLH